MRYTMMIAMALLISTIANLSHANCQSGRVRLQVLGSGGPELGDQRAGSSYLVWLDGKARVLIDMGPGSGLNFERSGAVIADLDAVLFSHLHVDHSADFPALVKASFFSSRQRDLHVFGPDGNNLMPSTRQFVSRMIGDEGAYPYLSNYSDPELRSAYHIKVTDIALAPLDIVSHTVSDEINISSIPVNHGPVAAVAWRVQAAGCSITFSGDMSNRYNTLARLAKNTDLLVAHNAIPEQARGVARNLHMPPSEIGKIAKQSGPHALLLSHRMRRTLGRETETTKYIQQHYEGPIMFADDMSIYLLPLVEGE